MAWSPDGRRLCVGDAKVYDEGYNIHVRADWTEAFFIVMGHVSCFLCNLRRAMVAPTRDGSISLTYYLLRSTWMSITPVGIMNIISRFLFSLGRPVCLQDNFDMLAFRARVMQWWRKATLVSSAVFYIGCSCYCTCNHVLFIGSRAAYTTVAS